MQVKLQMNPQVKPQEKGKGKPEERGKAKLEVKEKGKPEVDRQVSSLIVGDLLHHAELRCPCLGHMMERAGLLVTQRRRLLVKVLVRLWVGDRGLGGSHHCMLVVDCPRLAPVIGGRLL